MPLVINSQSQLLRKEIEKIIKYEQSIDFNVVPGILVGVIDGDSTFQFSFGRDIESEGIFEMGSLTKPVIAWLSHEALTSLGMDRSTSLCKILPDSVCYGQWENLTFHHILDHKSGLMRLPPGIGEIETDIDDPYKDYTLNRLGHDMRIMQPSPGTYSYSHVGYSTLYWLFEKVGGLEKFTKEALTEPHRLGDTKWDYPGEDVQQGHGLDGRPHLPWNTNALMPAIGLKSSINDMLDFVKILFEGYDNNRRRHDSNLLKKELKSMSKTGAYKVVDGWFVIRADKSLVYYHNGRTGGHHVSVAFTPHLKKGVVIIANGAMGSNDLSLLILRMVNQAEKKQKKINKSKA